jgi:hypothetical protein
MGKDSDIDLIISFPGNTDCETYTNNYFALAHELESLLKKTSIWSQKKHLEIPFYWKASTAIKYSCYDYRIEKTADRHSWGDSFHR